MASQSHKVNPLAVLLLRRGTVAKHLLDALHDDTRVELVSVRELSPDWVAFAQRVAAVLVATAGDPLDALTYVLTAGVSAPIVVAATAKYKRQFRDVVAAGAAACVTLPLKPADVAKLLRQLQSPPAPALVDSTLRLLLDPISRVVRYHNRSVRLSQREFAVLFCLSSHRGEPVAADELLTYVWGEKRAHEQSRQILEVYVFQLRKKLEELGVPHAISTVRRFGYALGPLASRSGT
jgi:DNA-binding response OmpR family regulator